MLRDHPDIGQMTQEFHSEKDGTFTPVWIVHTSLTLDALHPDFDLGRVNDLISTVRDFCAKQPEFHGRIIVREHPLARAGNS
jgi:hypothetical protein